MGWEPQRLVAVAGKGAGRVLASALSDGRQGTVTVSVGKDIPHPHTTEHYIVWIDAYFKPDDDAFTYHVGRFDLREHGESAKGPNKGPVYTDPIVTFRMRVNGGGSMVAMSLCNVHRLWQDSKIVTLKPTP